MSLVYVALAMFCIGLYGTLTRRDIVAVLASVEVMLGGATVLLIGLASTSQFVGVTTPAGETSSVGLVIIVLAAAEASVGLALMLSVARRLKVSHLDELSEVSG